MVTKKYIRNLKQKFRTIVTFQKDKKNIEDIRKVSDLDSINATNLECFCIFLGYPRSGHSLVGSLLNAHPNIVISHELDVLRFLKHKITNTELFNLIIARDKWFLNEQKGAWTGYNYIVDDLHQGEHLNIQVIGDKKGGKSSLRCYEDAGLLDELALRVALPLKIVHHVRNPYDIVTTHFLRSNGKTSLKECIDEHIKRSIAIKSIIAAGKHQVLELHHSDFCEQPENSIKTLIKFLLNEEAHDEYLHKCAAVVEKTISKSRYKIEWDSKHKKMLQDNLSDFEFFSRYNFHDN